MSTILAVLTGDPLSCTRVLHYSDKKSHTCEHGQFKGGGGGGGCSRRRRNRRRQAKTARPRVKMHSRELPPIINGINILKILLSVSIQMNIQDFQICFAKLFVCSWAASLSLLMLGVFALALWLLLSDFLGSL